MKYFQHDTNCRTNRKLRKVLRTHGATGYAIWWAVLEELYKSDERGFEIKADELWLETLAESLCMSDYRILVRVFDTFASVDLISRQHWEENYIFIKAIQERGDTYTQKKSLNAERQARFREKNREQFSRVSNALHEDNMSRSSNALRNAENGKVTLSEIRDQNSEIRDQKNLKNKVQEKDPATRVFSANENSIVEGEFVETSTSTESGTPPRTKTEIDRSGQNVPACAVHPWQNTPTARFYDTYNASKPALWCRVQKSTAKREKAIQKALREWGSESAALEAFESALLYCGQDAWWGARAGFDFDTLFEKDRIAGFSERWKSIKENPGKTIVSEILSDPIERKRAREQLDYDREVARLKAKYSHIENKDDVDF